MSHVDPGPLAGYNSLLDPHLAGYFSNNRIKKHLRKSGLVTKKGHIVSESTFRLNCAKKQHKQHVQDLLAHAIVHKTLDLERNRQVNIKKKLEEIAKIELVRRVRGSSSDWPEMIEEMKFKTKEPVFKRNNVTQTSLSSLASDRSDITINSYSTELSHRGDEDVLPFLTPRSALEKPKRKSTRAASGGKKRTNSAPQESKSLRPKSAPHNDHGRRRSIDSQDSDQNIYRHDESFLTDDSRPTNRKPRKTVAHFRDSELDDKHLFALDQQALREITMGRLVVGQSPYKIPPNIGGIVPTPPVTPRRSKLQKRRKSNNSNRGQLMLHRQEPAMKYQERVQTMCTVKMHYFGSSLKLDYERMDPRDEIMVEQQHCGGKIDCRVSTCCEYKHASGSRLGGRNGHFGVISIKGASPCYRCQISASMQPKKPTIRNVKRRPHDEDENNKCEIGVVQINEKHEVNSVVKPLCDEDGIEDGLIVGSRERDGVSESVVVPIEEGTTDRVDGKERSVSRINNRNYEDDFEDSENDNDSDSSAFSDDVTNPRFTERRSSESSSDNGDYRQSLSAGRGVISAASYSSASTLADDSLRYTPSPPVSPRINRTKSPKTYPAINAKDNFIRDKLNSDEVTSVKSSQYDVPDTDVAYSSSIQENHSTVRKVSESEEISSIKSENLNSPEINKDDNIPIFGSNAIERNQEYSEIMDTSRSTIGSQKSVDTPLETSKYDISDSSAYSSDEDNTQDPINIQESIPIAGKKPISKSAEFNPEVISSRLEIKDCTLTNANIQILLNLLTMHKGLRFITLQNCGLDTSSIMQISKYLVKIKNLEKLDLSNNLIKDLQGIQNIMEQCESITELLLSDNPISDKSACDFASFILKPRLVSLVQGGKDENIKDIDEDTISLRNTARSIVSDIVTDILNTENNIDENTISQLRKEFKTRPKLGRVSFVNCKLLSTTTKESLKEIAYTCDL